MATEHLKASGPDGRSTVRLLRDIGGETSTLVKEELQLFRQELLEAMAARVKAIAAFAAAGILGLFVVGFAGLAAADALSNRIAPWAARLVVAGAFLVAAGAAVLFARRRLKTPPLTPEETLRTVKEDVEWARTQLKR